MDRFIDKLFILSYLVYGCLVLLLFGIYFDVGELIGGFRFIEETAAQVVQRVMKVSDVFKAPDEDRSSRALWVMRSDWAEQIPTSSESMDHYMGADRAPTGEDFARWRREDLVSRGIHDSTLLRVETLGADRRRLSDLLGQAEGLIAKGLLDAAVDHLEEALREADTQNLIYARALLDLLFRVELARSNLEAAGRVADRLEAVLRRLLGLWESAAAAIGDPDENENVAELKMELGRLEWARNRMARSGDEPDLDAETVSDAILDLKRAHREGLISQAAYEEALAQLEAK